MSDWTPEQLEALRGFSENSNSLSAGVALGKAVDLLNAAASEVDRPPLGTPPQ